MRTIWSVVATTTMAFSPAITSEVFAEPATSSVEDAPRPREPVTQVLPQSLLRRSGAAATLGAQQEVRAAPLLRGMPFSVVEIPNPQPPGAAPTRPHHALSMRFEQADQALRPLGATNCQLQLRAPTKVSQARQNRTVEVKAQVRFGCGF